MAAIVYPAELPCPQTSLVTAAERRALSDQRAPREARQVQVDRLEYERITLPPMRRQSEAAGFLAFWRDTLIFGGAWFAADWPLPRGWSGTAVRKFVEQPRWEFIAGGFWRISAMCEVRGAGMNPQEPAIPPALGFTWNLDALPTNSVQLVLGDDTSLFNINHAFGNPSFVTGGTAVTHQTAAGNKRYFECFFDPSGTSAGGPWFAFFIEDETGYRWQMFDGIVAPAPCRFDVALDTATGHFWFRSDQANWIGAGLVLGDPVAGTNPFLTSLVPGDELRIGILFYGGVAYAHLVVDLRTTLEGFALPSVMPAGFVPWASNG